MIANDIRKVGQSATIATKLHKGEALFDPESGLPYIKWSLQKPVRLNEVSDFVKRTISGLNGVVRITSWVATFDRPSTQVRIVGSVVVEDESEFEIVVTSIGGGINSSPYAMFTITGIPAIYGGLV